MTDKTPAHFAHPLPTDYEREILDILIEECAEVQQRAVKLLRFGRDEVQRGQPDTNAARLSFEVGDLLAMIDLASASALVLDPAITAGKVRKFIQLAKFMRHAADLPRRAGADAEVNPERPPPFPAARCFQCGAAAHKIIRLERGWDDVFLDFPITVGVCAQHEEKIQPNQVPYVTLATEPEGPGFKLPPSDGAIDIVRERERQIIGEGHTGESDDAGEIGDLAGAASCYALNAACLLNPYNGTPIDEPPDAWQLPKATWKPSIDNPRRDLVKAGALIIAEIDRIDRGLTQQVERLRSKCAASGRHQHDGCTCTDAELIARSGSHP